jgi:hypothetical protein
MAVGICLALIALIVEGWYPGNPLGCRTWMMTFLPSG